MRRTFVAAAMLFLLSEAYVIVGIWMPMNIPWSQPSHYVWTVLRAVAEQRQLNEESVVFSADDHCGNALIGRACAAVYIDPRVANAMTVTEAKEVMEKICDYPHPFDEHHTVAEHFFGCEGGIAHVTYEIRVLGSDTIIRWPN